MRADLLSATGFSAKIVEFPHKQYSTIVEVYCVKNNIDWVVQWLFMLKSNYCSMVTDSSIRRDRPKKIKEKPSSLALVSNKEDPRFRDQMLGFRAKTSEGARWGSFFWPHLQLQPALSNPLRKTGLGTRWGGSGLRMRHFVICNNKMIGHPLGASLWLSLTLYKYVIIWWYYVPYMGKTSPPFSKEY